MANSENLLRRLRTTLDRSDTVLLIGSGTSLWSGLPTWEKLLIQLASFVERLGRDATAVRQEIKAGDLLLAASYAVHQLDLREFGAFVRQAINHPDAKPAEIHSLIATLGRSCFITTNYDRLLETAVSKFSPHGIPTVVTNWQVAEIADILPSYARRFVFKYHGDVEDAASIVLTRDQYRRIQHEYPATIRAFGTLLATRPVVMIGFGLRDLDFLAVKDELVAAFEGQVGEYFAIMPDFDHVRTEYWRTTYRTEIISYDTIVRSDGSHDHSNLVKLLESLQPAQPNDTKVRPPSSSSSIIEFTLRLARLAASVVRKKPLAPRETLPLTVSTEPRWDGSYPAHAPELSKLLQTFRHNFLLLGPPGSGKSFALANYAAELATVLLERCIQERIEPESLHVPVIVNLAIYTGDLRELIQGNLPTGIDLSSLLERNHCTVILDGVNEVPREYIENEKWITDFQELVSSAPNCRFILGSRNETWLSSLDLARFSISDIDSDFVAHHFTSIGKPEIAKNPELVRTLSKPLFFALASSHRIDLTAIATPADVYASFFDHIDANWRNELQQPINFASTLERVAFGMLEAGAEFAPKEQYEKELLGLGSDIADRAISYLLAQGVLIAHSGHRLSFFHQSATEYLAARIIARQFIEDKKSLRRRLEDKRWDQALFLAMSFLDENDRQNFLDEILVADLTAAARAAHYLEFGQEHVINEIILRATNLRPTTENFDFSAESRLARQLEQLPYTKNNIKALTRLFRRKGEIGGTAAGALFKMASDEHETLLDKILRRPDDWNYIQTFVRVSNRYWSADDFDFLIQKLRRKKKNADSLTIFGELIYGFVTPEKLISWCTDYMGEGSAVKYALIEALSNSDSREARSMLLDMIGADEPECIYALYSNLEFHTKDVVLAELPASIKVAERLISSFSSDDGKWAVSLAKKLIENNPQWRELFTAKPSQNVNTRLHLNLLLSDASSLADVISNATAEITKFNRHSLRVLGGLDFWETAPASTVLDAISHRNAFLAGAIMEQIQGRELPFLSIKELDWWLSWEKECLESKDRAIWWCGHMIGRFLNDADEITRAAVIARFNAESVDEFESIGRLVLREGAGKMSTEQLSNIAITRLLNEGRNYEFSSAVLGKAATEEFVRTVLLPHLAANPTYGWIRRAIEIAGDRHNRRYLVDNGELSTNRGRP